MGSFIIDSIGFSASHAMAAVLRGQPKFCVTHGSKNFKEGSRIGVNNLSICDFISQMRDAEETHDHCVAIHCLYDPATLAKEAKKNEVAFYGLCRKDIRGQILSGFFWALNKFLYGDPHMGQQAFAVLLDQAKTFVKLNISPNYMSALMFYSLQRVVGFNLKLAENTEGLIFMEDFLSRPTEFISLLCSYPINDEKIVIPKTISHKNRSSQHEFLVDHEETLDTLMTAVNISYQGNQIVCSEIYELIAEKSLLNP